MSSKLRKAGMETIAILAVLFATCLTINAQGAKFENELNGTTLAMAENRNTISSAKAESATEATLAAFAAYLAEEEETELETEEWMLNVDNFFMEYHLEEATETKLEVETWMLEDSLFNKKDKTKAKEKSESANESDVLAEAKTETKKKAVGVTNQKTQFGRRAMILIEDEDPKLKMEQWMLDYRHWKTK
ncbi:MAG: hypothetical protein ACP5D9_03365 [Mariniphaga sp.]